MQTTKNNLVLQESIPLEDELQIHCCPICKGSNLERDFSRDSFQVQICKTCGLKLLNPQPSDKILSTIYNSSYFLTNYAPTAEQKVSELKRATAKLYLNTLQQYRGYNSGEFLA